MIEYELARLESARKIAEDTCSLERAAQYLDDLGIVSFGIESVSVCDKTMSYIDFGDTYDNTVCREGNEFWVGSWGSWVEEVENQYCEKEGAIMCGYCGEFTPLEEGTDWRNCVCEHCGHLVGG